MTEKTADPPGSPPDATPKQSLYHEQDYRPARKRHPARCELHGVNLVHRFPSHCPLATSNPFETLARLQDAAWRVIGRGVHDAELAHALALLNVKDICMRCLDRALTHPTVHRLRARKIRASK